jgi:hypothetical protein
VYLPHWISSFPRETIIFHRNLHSKPGFTLFLALICILLALQMFFLYINFSEVNFKINRRFYMNWKYLILSLVSLLFLLTVCQTKKEEPKTEAEPEIKQEAADEGVSLSKDLLPVFVRSCGVCHAREGGNEKAVEHQVYYENKEDILGKVGKFIISGKPEESGLVKVLNQTYPVGDDKIVMPPPESEIQKWSDEEVALFEKWIRDGAKDN